MSPRRGAIAPSEESLPDSENKDETGESCGAQATLEHTDSSNPPEGRGWSYT